MYLFCCIFQDLKTKAVVTVGKEVEGLYVLDGSSFLKLTIQFYVHQINKINVLHSLTLVITSLSAHTSNKESFHFSNSTHTFQFRVFHAGFGHTSLQKCLTSNFSKTRLIIYILSHLTPL